MSEAGQFVVWMYGFIGLGCLVYAVLEEVRDRCGRVPVLEPAWYWIRARIEWWLRAPGRLVRWLRPRDTRPGLGGP